MTKKLRSPLKTLTWLVLVLSLVLQPVLQVLAETGEENYGYEVKYEDQAKNKLHKTKKEENNTKATLEKDDYEKKIVGYKLNKVSLGDTEVEAKEITLLPGQENKILLIYQDDPGQPDYEYEVEYVDEDGKKLDESLAKSEKKQIAKNTQLGLKDLEKEISAYSFKEFKLEYGEIIDGQVFIDRGGQIIKLVYEKSLSKYPYEIKYEDLDGKELHKTKKEENNTKSVLEKQDYAKEIVDYKLNKVFLGGTEVKTEKITLVADQENKIKLAYEKLGPVEKVSYRASYLDENNNKLRTDIQGEEDKGSILDLKKLEHKIDGYSYKETKLDGQVMTGKTYQLDRDIRLELIYKKDKVEKEYTIKLINKYMDNTDNTIEEKNIVARPGEKINLREVFTPKTRSVSHIGDIEFDQEEIYLGTSKDIAANAAVRTTYKLKFNEEELVLDGYIGQEIILPKEISGYSAPTASTIILDGTGGEKPAYTNSDLDAPVPLIKELEIKYEGPDNESLSQAEKLKTLDGISMKLKPKSIFGYNDPGEKMVIVGSDKLKFSYSKKDEDYKIRLVDRDANPILDREGLYIQDDKTGKIGQVHSLDLSTDQVEDLGDYTYPASFTLGESPYIGLVATKKSTGGGGGSSNSKVDYKIIHEDRDGKELDVEKGRGWIGEEIKAKRKHYRDHTFYRAEPKDEKIRLVADEKKNLIKFIYEKDRDRDSGSSSGGRRGSGSSGGSSSSSSLPKLRKDEHIQYIYGYEDGTIRPNALVSREEAAMMLYRLVDQDYSPKRLDFKGYKDLESTRWSYEAIKTLTELGVLTGYEDGNFRPTRPMTRAEVVAMMSKFEGMTNNKINRFTDTQGHWANSYINSAAENKWVNGYEDGSFKPDKPVTRAEFANLANKVLDRWVEADGVLPGLESFKDLDQGKWYYYPLVEASNGHDHRRYPNGREQWTSLN